MSLVQIPSSIRAAAAALHAEGLAAASAQMSERYRAQLGQAIALNAFGKQAYLAARFPATYASIVRALMRYRDAACPSPRTILDVGCGPGTASLAAAALWPDISAVTRSDADASWRPIAEALGSASEHEAMSRGRWLTGLAHRMTFPSHDMAIAAYALNEIPEGDRDAAIAALWTAADHALVLVEPGTPRGFLNIQRARTRLIEAGAIIAAPCPHELACPMSERDWCHTAVRLARDAAHRKAKGAVLAYEDEKFSYVVAVRAPPANRARSRIVKKPTLRTGHVRLDLCAPEGLAHLTISRRDGAHYKAARDAEWGDRWPPDHES